MPFLNGVDKISSIYKLTLLALSEFYLLRVVLRLVLRLVLRPYGFNHIIYL